MRWNYVVAGVGVALATAGAAIIGYAVLQPTGPGAAECVNNRCNGPISLPGGIFALVLGLSLGARGLRSIRRQRGNAGPLSSFGVMTGLGLVFAVLGSLLSFGSTGSGGGEARDTLLFVGGLFFLMGLGFVGIDLWRFRGAVKKDRLRVSGIHGTATVLGVSDSNVTINNAPLVNVDLDVDLPGQSRFRVRKRTLISRLSVGALSPGTVVSVLADPARPRDVMIDWEASASAPSGGAAFVHGSELGGRAGTIVDMATGVFEPMMIRLISQALAGAGDRAGHTGGVTHLPDGTTVIDGGTTVVIDGHRVDLAQAMGTQAALSIQQALAARAAQSAALSGTADHPADVSPASAPAAGQLDGDAAGVQGLAPGAGALPGRVNLESIQDSGVDMAGGRLYTFDLTVSVAGRPSYRTKFASVVPKALVPRLLQGASFPAHVDPDQPEQLAVEWDH